MEIREFPVPEVGHGQVLLKMKASSICGSSVTSLAHMEELLEKLMAWQLKPEVIVTHCFPLESAAEAFRIADEDQSGKACLVMD